LGNPGKGTGLNVIALRQVALGIAAMILALAPQMTPPPSPTAIEILADHDSRYKIAGMKEPVITLHAGQ
jgi:hypothetical protein